jgi:hypothetical protein
MIEATKSPCGCNTCPGSGCNCGCQSAVAREACRCGPQCRCGDACAPRKESISRRRGRSVTD